MTIRVLVMIVWCGLMVGTGLEVGWCQNLLYFLLVLKITSFFAAVVGVENPATFSDSEIIGYVTRRAQYQKLRFCYYAIAVIAIMFFAAKANYFLAAGLVISEIVCKSHEDKVKERFGKIIAESN